MTDPWEDVRYLSEKRPRGPWGTIAQVEIERLLTDADALLAVVRAAEELEIAYDMRTSERSVAEGSSRELEYLQDTLAALPEHLR